MTKDSYVMMIAAKSTPGMEAYLRHFFYHLMQQSQHEKGCIIYNIHESLTNVGEFMLYSVWESQADFENHNASEPMQEFKKQLSKKLFAIESPKTTWRILTECDDQTN